MSDLILYSGPHCKLCDDAEVLVWQAGVASDQLQKVDITESLQWKKAYGLRIPVLQRRDSGAELGWPFDLAALQDFLR